MTSGSLEIGSAPSTTSNAMRKPVKHSVAVAIFDGGRILSTRRKSDDDELPGIWGLPAGTRGEGESVQDLIRRIGRDKLGVDLIPIRKLSEGRQTRPGYQLEMELWEASLHGTPSHSEWRWASLETLEPGAAAGSLCCALAVGGSVP